MELKIVQPRMAHGCNTGLCANCTVDVSIGIAKPDELGEIGTDKATRTPCV